MSSDPAIGTVKPWGRLATFGLAFFAMLASQTAGLMALVWWYGVGLSKLPDFGGDGQAVMLIILTSTPLQLLLLAIFAGQRGGDVLGYLGLTLPRRSEVVFGVTAVVGMIVAGNILSWLIGINIVTTFQTNIFRTASDVGFVQVLLLVMAVVVLTPIGEEIMFRGFLFRGWLRGPRDVWPVIVVTSLLWALIHVQYDWYVTGQIFAFGLMLGWIRWATGSTVLTILLHGLINLEGMVETWVSLHWPT
jgi:membrane protease YdiL (CAAX protease family)